MPLENNNSRNYSANIILLGIVSFLNDLSSEMIMPILPMFVKMLGAGGVVIGLIGGLRDSVSEILKIFFGWWSDRIGKRKVFVVWGYLSSSIFKLFLAFANSWQYVLIFTGLERVGKGLRTAPRDAIIADSLPEQKGKGFGIHRTLDTLGAVLGSVVALILFWFFKFDFKLIIFIAAIIAFFSLIPLKIVKETKRPAQDIPLRIGIKNLPKPLKLFILVSSIFTLANFSYMFFILKAQESLVNLQLEKFSVIIPIILYILFNIFYALFAIPFGMLSDKIGKRKVIISGYLLFSFTCLGFAFSKAVLSFIILFILYGLVLAIIDANQRAYISDLSLPEFRATALGTFHSAVGLVSLPASLIAGFLWQNFSPLVTFLYGCVVSLAAVISFVLIKR